jgi:hypothetical protein
VFFARKITLAIKTLEFSFFETTRNACRQARLHFTSGIWRCFSPVSNISPTLVSTFPNEVVYRSAYYVLLFRTPRVTQPSPRQNCPIVCQYYFFVCLVGARDTCCARTIALCLLARSARHVCLRAARACCAHTLKWPPQRELSCCSDHFLGGDAGSLLHTKQINCEIFARSCLVHRFTGSPKMNR